MDQRTGSCLCGAVRITARINKPEIQACHCIQCQRWTGGGPYLAIGVSDLVVEGEDKIGTFRASSWGERANCKVCGTPVFWRMQGHAPRSISVGLLDDQSGLTVTEEIYVDHRPGWLPPASGASQSTEAQQRQILSAWQEKNQ